MINIKIIFPGPKVVAESLRKLDDLLPYQEEGVKLYLGYNQIGAMHCQNSIEEAFAMAGMANAAATAESEGMDAIVIESMGDTGLIQCREAVNIPVIGMSDVSFRLANMLGRRFGVITAGVWHSYAIERLMSQYQQDRQYIGSEMLNLQPFFTDINDRSALYEVIATSIINLVDKGADTIVLGGSYFLNMIEGLQKIVMQRGYRDVLILDPLANAIHFARFMVAAKLGHSKRIYATPMHATPVIGYVGIDSTMSMYKDA